MLINVIKINILAVVCIAVAMIISHFIKNKYSVRWKYFVWLFIGIFMMLPFDFISADPVFDVKIPQNIYVGDSASTSNDTAEIWNKNDGESEKDQVFDSENYYEDVNIGNDFEKSDSEEKQNTLGGSDSLYNSDIFNGSDTSDAYAQGNNDIPSYDRMIFEQNRDFAQTYGNVFDQGSDGALYQNSGSNYEESVQTTISVETIIKILTLVWLCGIAILAVYHILQYIFSSRRLRRWRSRKLTDSERAIYAKVCERLEIKKAPELYINYEIYTPLMAGIIKPCLHLPVEKYTNWELELIFVHELNHYKHKDVLYKFFLIIVKTVYWFNPLLYIMFNEAGRDLESICDSRVIDYTKNKEEKISYGKLLLKTAIEKKPVSEVAADLNDGVSKFKERVLYMMNARKMKKGFPIALVLIISLVAMNSLIGCSFTQDTGNSSSIAENEKVEESADNNTAEDQPSESETESEIKGNEEQTDNVNDKENDGEDIITSDNIEASVENDKKTIELSEYFENYKYRVLEKMLDMEPVEIPALTVGFEKNGFYLSYSLPFGYEDEVLSCGMSNKGNDDVQLYGCSIGDDIEKFEKSLIDNGWLRQGKHRLKENYIKLNAHSTYWVYLKFGADGKVTEWRWSDWKEGEFDRTIYMNIDDFVIDIGSYLYDYEPLISAWDMERTESWDSISSEAYVKDGFYIEFDQNTGKVSMKNEGNELCEILGLELGQHLNIVEYTLLEESWIKLEEGVYIRKINNPRGYEVFRLEFTWNADGGITSWYFNNWQEDVSIFDEI